MEQPRCKWRCQLQKNAESTCGFAENSHFIGIPTKCRDIAVYPLQGELLIHDPVVARDVVRRFCTQCRIGEEPQSTKPVIERNDNYALLHELRWHVVITFANGECTTVNPHHHRICAGGDGLVGYVGREDIQVETILCDTCSPKDGRLLWAVV